MDFADIIIIGSGFGGAVMAARLGQDVAGRFGGNKTVLMLEKGNDHTGEFDPDWHGPPLNDQGNRFRHSLAPDYLADLAEVHTDADGTAQTGVASFNVVTGLGLGGGSNVYSGVSLRAPTLAFEQTRGGRRLWPARYSRAALNPYYAKVEAALKVHRLRWTDQDVPHWQLAAKRDLVFAEGCRRIGATAVPLKVATDNDANEGWWTQGQRFQGRQNLTKNYLALAKAAGVRFQCRCEVREIAPIPTGYLVRLIDRRLEVEREQEIECRQLIVAGGAIASTSLLLRSRDNFPGDRRLDPGPDSARLAVLGKHLSGNGDYGVTGTVGEAFELAVETHKGKPISSISPSWFREHQFVLLPFYAEPLYLALGRISTLLRAEEPTALGRRSTSPQKDQDNRPERSFGLAYKQRLSTFGRRLFSMGCLALDEGEGEIVLGAADDLQVRWSETHPSTERRWSAAADAMRRIYEALGGEMFLDGYRKDGTVNTSHPLGGCRMAEDAAEGIVDANGEHFRNPGLFVVDSAIIPSGLAANPTLTIAAVAESIAERLIDGVGMRSLERRLSGL